MRHQAEFGQLRPFKLRSFVKPRLLLVYHSSLASSTVGYADSLPETTRNDSSSCFELPSIATINTRTGGGR